MESWELNLPKRGEARLGARKPRAELVLSEEGLERRLSIPVVVAKRLRGIVDERPWAADSARSVLELERDLERKCCSERAESLLNRRDYSTAEMRAKLLEDGFYGPVVDEYLRRASDVGLLDDARYADAFIRSKASSGWGERKVSAALRARGVDAGCLDGWPFEYFDEGNEFERALQIASRKTFSERNRFSKVVRFVMGRGFSGAVAYDVAHKICDDAE